jgi:integrase
MPRMLNRLTPKSVAAKKERGYYADGGGLYLQVSSFGTKSWAFRFARNGRQREMGLGPVHTVSLAEARDKALGCRKQLQNGIDPIDARKESRASEVVAKVKMMTFDQCADAYVEANRAGWKSAKHADQWESTLKTYASPVIGSLPVAFIDTGLVLKVLEKDQLWTTKPETANRLRGRIEAVLGWATVHKYRSGENPAQWKNHLDKVLPPRSKVASIEHHPALSYNDIGAFIASLRLQPGHAPRALEFAILTNTRTSETIGATWREINLDAGVWIIPADRMKAAKEHHVPLSGRAIEILTGMPPCAEEGGYVFPGRKERSSLSNMALLEVVRRMNHDKTIWKDRNGEPIVPHGFRSTFRDWAGETTAYPREVIEHAMAHQLPDKAEAAYARGTLFDKRKRLMADWAAFCSTVSKEAGNNVVPINSAA